MMTYTLTSDWYFFQPAPVVKPTSARNSAAASRPPSPKKRTPPERDFHTPTKKARTTHSPQADNESNDTQRRRSGGEGIIPELRDARQIMSHDMDLRREQRRWTVDSPPQPGPWTEEQLYEHNMANAKLDWLMGKYSTMSSCVPRCYHENCKNSNIHLLHLSP
jgi:hypothetical protein